MDPFFLFTLFSKIMDILRQHLTPDDSSKIGFKIFSIFSDLSTDKPPISIKGNPFSSEIPATPSISVLKDLGIRDLSVPPSDSPRRSQPNRRTRPSKTGRHWVSP